MPETGFLSSTGALNPEQESAVIHEAGALLILAGAGSGKTRVVTSKIAWLIHQRNVNPRSILAVTFTKKAAAEMRERAVALDSRAQFAEIRTFHSFGAKFLRANSDSFKAFGVNAGFVVYDDADSAKLVELSNTDLKLKKGEAAKYAHLISLEKDYCRTPEDTAEAGDSKAELFARIYKNYENRLRETGNVDFGDLIMLPVFALEKDADLRSRTRAHFSVIMVDEYQDSNVAQFRLLKALHGASGSESDLPAYVCAVGDDDQSIYKFRGAEISNILSFQRDFPDCKVIRLETNYRSTSQILDTANDVIKHNTGRLGKTLRAAKKARGAAPVLAFLQDQDEEAAFCADLIEQSSASSASGASQSAIAPASAADWAILYRTNAQSRAFETEFLRRGIPYVVVGTLKFYEREEVKDILAYLALIINPKDEVAFRRVVNKPARSIGEKSQSKIIQAARSASADFLSVEDGSLAQLPKNARASFSRFKAMLRSFSDFLISSRSSSGNQPVPVERENLSLLVDKIAEESGLAEHYKCQDEIADSQKTANIQELANGASVYELSLRGLVDFLDSISLDRSLELPDDPSSSAAAKVTLITLHNTKGLEFNRVIMTGMEAGLFPRSLTDESELEEERRLCYVGITRAKSELYFTSCAVRRLYGHENFMTPSPFLSEISPEHLRIIGRVPPSFNPCSRMQSMGFGKRGLSHPDLQSEAIMKDYRRGAKIFHDDYGYGVITGSRLTQEGEYAVTVLFEGGSQKQFLPKYQRSSLLLIKD